MTSALPSDRHEPGYFPEVCEEVLYPWFKDRGFWKLDAYCSATMVAFRRRKVFARFYYLPRDSPRYPVLAGLGDLREGFGLFGPRRPMLHGLGLWEVVDDEADREVLRRTFRTAPELRRLLEAMRERALPWADRMFEDPALLRQAIRRRG